MELEERAKDETTLPAQRDVAKQAANSLKSEIATDIQPQQEEPEVGQPATEQEEVPVSPPAAGKIGNLRIAQEDQPIEVQPPIEVPRAIPDDFRLADPESAPSTAIAEMYANQQPAAATKDLTDSEAVGDEVGDIAYQTLRQKGYEPTEAEGGRSAFFVNSLAAQEGTVDEAFNSLADEYIETYSPKAPAKNRMSIESIEDQAAEFLTTAARSTQRHLTGMETQTFGRINRYPACTSNVEAPRSINWLNHGQTNSASPKPRQRSGSWTSW